MNRVELSKSIMVRVNYMATTKKQVSNSKKPKPKNVVAEAEVKNTVARSKVKAIVTEESNVEENPRIFISRRVWPD